MCIESLQKKSVNRFNPSNTFSADTMEVFLMTFSVFKSVLSNFKCYIKEKSYIKEKRS